MGSRPDGWWRDRAGAAVRLHGELVHLAASGRAVPPKQAPPNEAPPNEAPLNEPEQAPPAFVMVLEGAARAATDRIGVADLAGLAAEVRPGEVTVVQASGSGDDAIVAAVRELAGGRVLVVTADRELRARCVAAGGTVAGPGWLLGLLRP